MLSNDSRIRREGLRIRWLTCDCTMSGHACVLASALLDTAGLSTVFVGTRGFTIALITICACNGSSVDSLVMRLVGVCSFATISTYVGGFAAVCIDRRTHKHVTMSVYAGGFPIVFTGGHGFITAFMCTGGLTISCTKVCQTLPSTLQARAVLLSTLRAQAASPSSIPPLCLQQLSTVPM